MNSIVSTDGRLAEIENNIHTLKKDVAHGLIEIGKNLIEAKTLVKHGEWSSWLENNVGFSQRSAQNYMRLARTFSGLDVSGLDASKLFLLQEMPEDERAGFLKEKDVSSMSVREMKAAIRGDCVPPIQSGSMADLDDEIWRAFDKESDATEYYVPVRLLKPIDRYEEYFGPRIGQEYIEYLELMELFHETSDGNELPIIITRDYTVYNPVGTKYYLDLPERFS